MFKRGWLAVSLLFISSKAVEDYLVPELCVGEIRCRVGILAQIPPGKY